MAVFAEDAVLDRMSAAIAEHCFRAHEFGDSMLIVRQARVSRR